MERQALYFTAPRQVALQSEPLPSPAFGQVLVQTIFSAISPGTESSIESQEALKLLFRAKGRNIGPPMYPPYVNYNGVYGQFDPVPISKRDDCLACGKIEGEESINIALPITAALKDIWNAFKLIDMPLEPSEWLITNPMTKEIIWDPNASNPIFKDPNVTFKADLKINSNDIIAMTPLGKAKEESKINKYNIIISYITNI